MGTAERAALGVALRHIDAARAIANAPRTRWQRWRSWWTGEDADLAWANLRAAQVALIACLSPNAVRVMIPEIEAAAETYGEETPALAAFTEWSRHRPRDAPLGEADRRVLQAAVTQIDRVASVSAVRLRGFRNVLLVAWLVLTVLAVGVAILGAVAPTAVLLCGDRGQAATSTGGGGVACPSGSATPSGADVAYVELLGTVGAALAVAATLRGIRATTGTYDIAVALALLKLPVGALAALTGVVLLHGGFVPGFTAATGSATAAYAVIFGYASLLLTRLVDRQADIVVEPVDHPTPVQTPEPEPEAEPEAEAGPERRASPG
jgi:hypothetical protein